MPLAGAADGNDGQEKEEYRPPYFLLDGCKRIPDVILHVLQIIRFDLEVQILSCWRLDRALIKNLTEKIVLSYWVISQTESARHVRHPLSAGVTLQIPAGGARIRSPAGQNRFVAVPFEPSASFRREDAGCATAVRLACSHSASHLPLGTFSFRGCPPIRSAWVI